MGGDFAKLPEAERAIARKALEDAWKTPEVEAARDRLMQANEDFRKTIQEAVKKSNPEAARILAKIRPPSTMDIMRDRFRLPPPDDPRFADVAVARLGMELYNFAKPEHRDAVDKLHERVIALPSVAAAISLLRASTGESRMEAFKKLAAEYKLQVDLQVTELKKKHPAGAASPPDAAKK